MTLKLLSLDQYQRGYLVPRGRDWERRPYKVIRRDERGNVIVIDPATPSGEHDAPVCE